LLGASKKIVVAGEHSRSHENAILDGRIGGGVGVGFELAVPPDAALVFDGNATADYGEVTHRYILSDGSKIGDPNIFPEPASCVQHGMGTDKASRADNSRWLQLLFRHRAICSAHRLLADYGSIIDANALTDPRSIMDNDMTSYLAATTDVHVRSNTDMMSDTRMISDSGAASDHWIVSYVYRIGDMQTAIQS